MATVVLAELNQTAQEVKMDLLVMQEHQVMQEQTETVELVQVLVEMEVLDQLEMLVMPEAVDQLLQ